jgi:hypothetical protein
MESYYTQNDQYRLANCYTGRLATYYNLTQENLSFPGASLQSMQWNLMWWLNNHDNTYINESIIVVGLTDESRTSWYDPDHDRGGDDPPWNNYLHAQWLAGAGPNIDRNWHVLHKHYLSLSACDALYKLNYETTTRMFDGISARYDIPVIQFNLLSTTKILLDTMHDIDVRNVIGNHYKSNGHPSEQGHENISKFLINYIDLSL